MKKILALSMLIISAWSFQSCSDLVPNVNLPEWTFRYDFWINPDSSGNKFAQDEVIEADIKSFLEENGVTFDPEKIKSVKISGLEFEIMNTEPVNYDINFSWVKDIQSSLEITGTSPKGPDDVALFLGTGPEDSTISMAVNNELELKDYFLKEAGDVLRAKASGELTKDLTSKIQIKATLKIKVTL